MLIRRNRKRQITEGIELPNQEKIRAFGEKETYKYLGILEVDTIKQVKMKEKKIKIEYLRRTRKLLRYSGRTSTNGREDKKANDHA